MNVLRVILGLMIGWIILVLLFFIGIFHVLAGLVRGLVRGLFRKRPFAARNPQDEAALEMVRCPSCGTYTSGTCSNPQCLNG